MDTVSSDTGTCNTDKRNFIQKKAYPVKKSPELSIKLSLYKYTSTYIPVCAFSFK